MQHYLQFFLRTLFLIAISWSGAVLADPIAYNQATLGWESITSLPNPGAANTITTFEFDITNGTNVNWTDYHFQFSNPLGSVSFNPNTVSIANIVLLTNPFNQSKIDANNALIGGGPEREALLTLFGGIVKPGDTFKIQLALTYNNSVYVKGIPSIPEPPTLFLWGLGYIALMAFRRTFPA